MGPGRLYFGGEGSAGHYLVGVDAITRAGQNLLPQHYAVAVLLKKGDRGSDHVRVRVLYQDPGIVGLGRGAFRKVPGLEAQPIPIALPDTAIFMTYTPAGSARQIVAEH